MLNADSSQVSERHRRLHQALKQAQPGEPDVGHPRAESIVAVERRWYSTEGSEGHAGTAQQVNIGMRGFAQDLKNGKVSMSVSSPP